MCRERNLLANIVIKSSCVPLANNIPFQAGLQRQTSVSINFSLSYLSCLRALDGKQGGSKSSRKVLSVRRQGPIECNSIGKLYFSHFLFQVLMFLHGIPTEISSKSCLFYDEFFSDRKNEKLLVAVWLWN